MPYLSNNGVRIFYRTEPADGSADTDAPVPLLLLHGFMQTSQDWIDAGYVKELAPVRPLILVDARGHGRSDKPQAVADYPMESLVADLIPVLDTLGVPAVDFFGYSFGAWVGFGLARYAPHRLRSLILGGMHPYVRDPGPLNRRIDRFTKTRDALAAGGHHADLIPAHVREQFADHDIEALLALTPAIRDSAGFEDGLDNLQRAKVPALIYAGAEDPAWPLAKRCVAGRDNLAFLSLPGQGHMDAWNRNDIVLPHVLDFLQRVNGIPR